MGNIQRARKLNNELICIRYQVTMVAVRNKASLGKDELGGGRVWEGGRC